MRRELDEKEESGLAGWDSAADCSGAPERLGGDRCRPVDAPQTKGAIYLPVSELLKGSEGPLPLPPLAKPGGYRATPERWKGATHGADIAREAAERATAEDPRTGRKEPRSPVPTEAEEAMIVAVRRHTLLPPDDRLPALRPAIPPPTRPALPGACSDAPFRAIAPRDTGECLSRLPGIEGDRPKRQRSTRHPIGFFRIDIAEAQTAASTPRLFVGTDRAR
jgi:hypothetical protein